MRTAALGIALVLVGCAVAPNTPGAGAGASYTPVIDMQGVDGARYSQDLAACRSYAAAMDNRAENVNAVIGGQLFSAAMMAALGGNSRQIGQAANAGGLHAINRHSGRVMTRQESVLGNCMATRGYRVLDGTAQVTYTLPAGGMPSQAAPPTAAPALPGAPTAAPTMQPATYTPPSIVTLPTGAGNPPPPVEATGKDAYVAERLARQLKCSDASLAKLVGKGAGYESYSMSCSNGETLLMRCEFGNCRALK